MWVCAKRHSGSSVVLARKRSLEVCVATIWCLGCGCVPTPPSCSVSLGPKESKTNQSAAVLDPPNLVQLTVGARNMTKVVFAPPRVRIIMAMDGRTWRAGGAPSTPIFPAEHSHPSLPRTGVSIPRAKTIPRGGSSKTDVRIHLSTVTL